MVTLTDIVVIKRDPLKEKIGSIFIPECVKSNEERGIYTGSVVVAGPKCREVKVGDRVFFARTTYVLYQTEEFGEVAGLHESDILGVIEGEPK
jgi:co-chaperonin GroES (HSP10)